jgi:hypothetical protein
MGEEVRGGSMITEGKFRVGQKLQDEVVCDSVLELGAGIFRFFNRYTASLKVGIELIDAYVDQRVCAQDVVALQGDILEFEEVLANAGIDAHFDIILLIDIVEHLDKDAAIDLIRRVQLVANKAIVFTPLGFEEQHGHEHVDFGRGIKLTSEQRTAAIAAQKHKSGWSPEDFETLGFDVLVDPQYHRANLGAIWAQWEKV